MKISVVIPSYNGWDRLGILCTKINKSLLINFKLEDFEIIIVDDGSKNRSDKLITELKNLGMDVTGVFLKKNYGQQYATLAGLIVSGGDYVITIDDDFSHNPEDINKLFSAIKKGKFDVIYGISKSSRTGLLRKSGSVLRDLIFNLFFKKPKGISVSSFRILNRILADKIKSDILEFRYLSVEILKHTKAIGNIPVEYNRESGSNSRYSIAKLVILALSLVRCSRFFPKSTRKTGTASEMEWDLI